MKIGKLRDADSILREASVGPIQFSQLFILYESPFCPWKVKLILDIFYLVLNHSLEEGV